MSFCHQWNLNQSQNKNLTVLIVHTAEDAMFNGLPSQSKHGRLVRLFNKLLTNI